MIVGQRVHYRHVSGFLGAIIDEGDGIVVAFLSTLASADGALDWRDSIVVQTDDGRFIYCRPSGVRVIEAEVGAAL